MTDFLQRLKERHLVRWALAYVAGAWVVVEVMSSLGPLFDVPVSLQRAVVVLLAAGLVVTLVVAWFHGEKGSQHVSGTELLLVSGVLLAAAGGLALYGSRDDPDAGESGVPGDVAAPVGAADGPASAGAPPRSVAVLPFTDLSPQQDQSYFGDGIAEEVRSVLSQLDGLRVASSTSSLSVDDRRMAPREIGERLGVGHLVEGSVRKSGDRLRVDARLVSVEDGFDVWSDRFDSEVGDIFAIQDSIARSVARAFQIGSGGAVPAVPGQTEDHVAQDLYLRGRFAWNRRTRESLEDAVGHFSSALERDPDYARALVGLGDAYAVLGFYSYRPPSQAFPAAQDAARAALAIDSTLAEPHATLGYAALYYEWDWAAAEESFQTAIRLGPGYPVAHQWYANYLTAAGRFDQAEREMRLASELDPLSMIAFAAIGWVQLYSEAYRDAKEQLANAIERDPAFEISYLWSGMASAALGDLAEAEALVGEAVELSGGSAITRAALARVLALQGRSPEARDILGALGREARTTYVPSYELARAWIALDEFELALDLLEQAMEQRAPSVVFIGVDAQLDAIRERPRFQALLQRIAPPSPR